MIISPPDPEAREEKPTDLEITQAKDLIGDRGMSREESDSRSGIHDQVAGRHGHVGNGDG